MCLTPTHSLVMIDQATFGSIEKIWGPHRLDCFAAMNNTQLPEYVSFRPDPYALYSDFMSRTAPKDRLYCFPPFNLILALLSKFDREELSGTIIVPFWPTSPWWPVLLKRLSGWPLLLPPDCSHQPRGIFEGNNSMIPNLQLLACPISGTSTRVEVFQKLLGRTLSESSSKGLTAKYRLWMDKNATFESTRGSELLELMELSSSQSKVS